MFWIESSIKCKLEMAIVEMSNSMLDYKKNAAFLNWSWLIKLAILYIKKYILSEIIYCIL